MKKEKINKFFKLFLKDLKSHKSLRELIRKEMIWRKKDKLIFEIMKENPTLVEFWGVNQFKKRAEILYDKFAKI